ncbi:hypothetical protein D3C71_1848320 [compost metagenome]
MATTHTAFIARVNKPPTCPDMRTPAASEAITKAGIRACETPAGSLKHSDSALAFPRHTSTQ